MLESLADALRKKARCGEGADAAVAPISEWYPPKLGEPVVAAAGVGGKAEEGGGTGEGKKRGEPLADATLSGKCPS